MSDLLYTYSEIVKYDKRDDGTLVVYGKATDSSIDIDQQICDPAWLDRAMPEWFKTGGNIREQHSSIAAGVATDYEKKSDGHYIQALVVDPNSIKKVETRVLKGFSIGIRSPRVIRDQKAVNGRIIDGMIVEVSLVDRPANPNAKLMLAKSVEGSLVQVEELAAFPTPNTIKHPGHADQKVHGRGGEGSLEDAAYEYADRANDDLRAAHSAVSTSSVIPTEPKLNILEDIQRAQSDLGRFMEEIENNNDKTAQSSINKFDRAAFETARDALSNLIAAEAEEIKLGHDERSSLHALLESVNHLMEWYDNESVEGETSPMLSEGIEMSVDKAQSPEAEDEKMSDEKCPECGKSLDECKCEKSEEADSEKDAAPTEEKATKSDEDESDENEDSEPAEDSEDDEEMEKTVSIIIAKAVESAKASVLAEIDLIKAAKEAADNRVNELEQELQIAKSAAAQGGPKRIAPKKRDEVSDFVIKAAEYNQKAAATTDPVLAKGYKQLAQEFLAKSATAEA